MKNSKKRYKHLGNVEVQLLDGPIDLLISQYCPSVLCQLESKYGKKDEPYAVRTRLGWSICGTLGKTTNVRLVQLIISPLNETEHLNYALKKFWEIE